MIGCLRKLSRILNWDWKVFKTTFEWIWNDESWRIDNNNTMPGIATQCNKLSLRIWAGNCLIEWISKLGDAVMRTFMAFFPASVSLIQVFWVTRTAKTILYLIEAKLECFECFPDLHQFVKEEKNSHPFGLHLCARNCGNDVGRFIEWARLRLLSALDIHLKKPFSWIGWNWSRI